MCVTKKQSKPKKPLSEKQRASDDALREELRHADMKKFDKLMERTLSSPSTKSVRLGRG
jgi:hypothetical protein